MSTWVLVVVQYFELSSLVETATVLRSARARLERDPLPVDAAESVMSSSSGPLLTAQ